MDWLQISFSAIIGLLLALMGYLFGIAKSFRERKQNVYEEILPIIIKTALDPHHSDEAEFNRALMKLHLYGNKKVTKTMDAAVSISLHPERGNVIEAFQKTIAAMRADIQISPLQRVKSNAVRHFYIKIAESIGRPGQNQSD